MGDGNRDRSLSLPCLNPIETITDSPIQFTLASFATQLFKPNLENKFDYSVAYLRLLKEKELISCNGGFICISKVIEQLNQYWQTFNFCEHSEMGVPLVLKDLNSLAEY